MLKKESCLVYENFVKKYQLSIYPLLAEEIKTKMGYLPKNILDVGTGPGFLSKYLAKKFPERDRALCGVMIMLGEHWKKVAILKKEDAGCWNSSWYILTRTLVASPLVR